MFIGSIFSMVGYGLSVTNTSTQPKTNKIYGYVKEISETIAPQPTSIPKPVQPTSIPIISDSVKFTILDLLINVMVNSLVSRTNDLYEYYRSFFLFYINSNFGFRNKIELVALNISTKLEYLINLKSRDKDISLMMKMTRHYDRLKNHSDFNQRNYDKILLQLNKYKEVIVTFDLQKIIDFLFEITCLICENFNYIDINNIRNQFFLNNIYKISKLQIEI